MSNIIYSVPCGGCDKSYIGQTGQYLKKRLYQHQYDIKKEIPLCALAQHVHESRHEFNFEGTKILDKENNYNKRLLKEMLFITKHKTVNKKLTLINSAELMLI